MNSRPVTSRVAADIARQFGAIDPSLIVALILELLPLLLACAGSEIRAAGWMRAEEYWQPVRGIMRRWRERIVHREVRNRWHGHPAMKDAIADSVVEELRRIEASTMLALYREIREPQLILPPERPE